MSDTALYRQSTISRSNWSATVNGLMLTGHILSPRTGSLLFMNKMIKMSCQVLYQGYMDDCVILTGSYTLKLGFLPVPPSSKKMGGSNLVFCLKNFASFLWGVVTLICMDQILGLGKVP